LPALCERVAADTDQQRGEFVVLIAGSSEDVAAACLIEGKRVFELLRDELPPGRAAKLASEISGAPRNALYAVRDEK
jgi:16S rRNA (cytidine1402-2'-O)-methyltransferase